MFQPNSTVSITFRCYGCFKISCQIDEKIRVSRKLTLICAGNKRFPTDRGVKKGGKGISHPRGDFSHTGYQEGWETDFPPTGGVHTHRVSRRVGNGFPTHGRSSHGGSSHTRGVKKGGKRISHPRGEFTHTGGVHTHGGSSHTRGVKKGGKRISHPRGEFTHTGGVLTHGVSRRVGKGFPTPLDTPHEQELPPWVGNPFCVRSRDHPSPDPPFLTQAVSEKSPRGQEIPFPPTGQER